MHGDHWTIEYKIKGSTPNFWMFFCKEEDENRKELLLKSLELNPQILGIRLTSYHTSMNSQFEWKVPDVK